MITKTNVLTGVIGLLVVVVIVQIIMSQVSDRKNTLLVEELYQIQTIELEEEKKGYREQLDSMQLVVADKEQLIQNLETSLYRSIKTSKKNNVKYAKLKKNAKRITNADSLSRILTNRYKNKRQR